MKRFLRFLSLFCVAALLLSAVPALQAESSPTLYFTNCTVTMGGSQSYCYLRMSGAENISAMDYMIIYDADNLELASISNAGFTNGSDVTVSANTSEPGVIRVTLISQSGLNGSNYLNLMYFKATEGAVAGMYPISVVVNDIYDSSLETVTAIKESGTVTVKEPTQTVKRVSFSSYLSASSVEVGENVTFRISASSLNGLSAGTFDFTYDETRLELDGVTLSDAMEGTVHDINTSRDGLVKISFASETAITSGYDAVMLDFTAISAGTASIGFVPSNLYDSEFTAMTASELSRTLTVTEPEIVVDNPDLWIDVPESVPSNKEFTVRVMLEGGSGVRSGDFTVTYDTDMLECLGVSAEDVDGAWLVTDKNYSEGRVRFSLMSNVDIEEDAALVTVTLKALDNLDSKSDMTVTGSDVYDAQFNVITLEYIGARINAVRPEYTVSFYDFDGETLLFSQKVMSGNSAIPPKTTEIRKYDRLNHLKFSGWDKDYSIITDDTDITAMYSEEAHTVLSIPDKAPGFNTPGSIGGTYCIVCGDTVTEATVVPPTGAVAKASVDAIGVLTFSGVLSDSTSTEGTTMLLVYDVCGRMMVAKDITAEDQTSISVQIPACGAAETVKLIRWDMATLKPLADAVICEVTK